MVTIFARRGFRKHRRFWCGGLVRSAAESGDSGGGVRSGVGRRVRDILLVVAIPHRVGLLPLVVVCTVSIVVLVVIVVVSVHIPTKSRRTVTHMMCLPSTSTTSTNNTSCSTCATFGRNDIDSFAAEDVVDVFGLVG